MATTDTGSEQYDSDAQGVVVADSDGVRALVTPQAETVVVGQGSVPQEAVREVPEPAPAVEQPPLVAHEPESSFEDMLAAAEAQAVEQPDFEPGDRITGVVEVVSLHGREVFLDIGGKATGYILKSEVSDENGQVTVKQGETIEGIVIGTDFNGVRIGRRLSRQGADFSALKDAFGAGMPVEGKVSGTNKGGYDVLLGGARGFCPFSQIDLYRPADPESFVGQTFEFKITELKGKQVVLSRAALLKAEQAERAKEVRAKLMPGARFNARVRSIQKFGVFADLGGLDGLIHVSELSWTRVQDPHEVVSLGQEIEVIVLEVDEKRDRIALSLRQALADPFEAAAEELRQGAVVEGKVVRLTNFGAFVNLASSVDGLIHISDLAHHRVRHPKEILNIGDSVRVKIQDIDLDRRRVGLSLKALATDPWDTAAERYKVGAAVSGRVESVQTFGVFIEVESGVTALLPASESGLAQGQPLTSVFKPGNTVEARVLRVDASDRKMALSLRDEDEIRDRAERGDRGAQGARRGGPGRQRRGPGRDTRSNQPRSWIDAGNSGKGNEGQAMGSLGELLLKALKTDDD